MLTIKEDYVSFETALLLKKKGFDCSSYHHYKLDNGEMCNFNTNCNTNLKQNNYITAPTLQMTMKWLREVHKLNIHINVCNKYFDNDPRKDLCYLWYINEIKPGVKHLTSIAYENTYEQAAEAAIKYCLENLI